MKIPARVTLLFKKFKAKSEDRLFVRVLEYAYNRKEFTRAEIEKDLDITDSDEQALFRHLFESGTNDSPQLLIGTPRNGINKFVLSRSGEELALEYIELKEARASSRNAIYIAVISMGIAVVTGLFQVLSQLYPEEIRTWIGCFF